MILDEILLKRKIQLEREINSVSRDEMKQLAIESKMPIISFSKALKKDRLSVICEVKKASPSKGLIRENFNPVEIAEEYEKAGADAISCLTEEYYFKGSSEFLTAIREKVNIPIIRKDFIFDEYQIYEAKVIGANAVLLIAAMLSTEEMKRFYDLAESLGLECLVETHNEEELEKTIKFMPKIIGVNNRNLKTFDVDLNATERLGNLMPEETILVSESGIKDNSDMKLVRSLGADAVLIGETLMRSDNITSTLHKLREDV